MPEPSLIHKRCIIISAPSGAGKSTLINRILPKFPMLEFSVSATTRKPRGEEQHGKDYYFFSNEEFSLAIEKENFLEYEEVYAGYRYGTLLSEVDPIWKKNHLVLFDVDVKGGIRIKQLFMEDAISIFIAPPSLEILRQRLDARNTDSENNIKSRLARAEEEMRFSHLFDHIIVNDNIDKAVEEISTLITHFVEQKTCVQ